jgi:thiamine kinase-like enzyme
MEKEIQLTGGRSTDDVVKSDNIVFRPHKNESDFANKFLKYLETKNFPYSQRYLGRDEKGRDKFLYIDGYVPNEIGDTNIEQLCRFMQTVRNFHDLSLGFTNSEKVICHNDLSPCNTVFVNNMPDAIIDWDSCAVGERWEDIAYFMAMDKYRLELAFDSGTCACRFG